MSRYVSAADRVAIAWLRRAGIAAQRKQRRPNHGQQDHKTKQSVHDPDHLGTHL
jgi:hypothetical protein